MSAKLPFNPDQNKISSEAEDTRFLPPEVQNMYQKRFLAAWAAYEPFLGQ